MKLYHYIARPNTVSKDGILSLSQNPRADLSYYYKRTGETTYEGIIKWFEKCFEGRSRGIRGFSEPVKWTENSLSLKQFIEGSDMYSIDLDSLSDDGLLEAVYFSPSVMDVPTLKKEWVNDELLIRLHDYNDISVRPVDWTICNDKLGWRFAFVPYYVIIVKGGIIPPKYIKKEN